MGRSSKYTREVLTEAVEASTSIAGVLRHLGVTWSGGMHAHISRRIKFFQLDTSHFIRQAHNKGIPSPERLTAAAILILRPTGSRRAAPHLLRRALIELGVPHRCASCGVEDAWNGLPLILHVDHIDGNHLDSRPDNVRFLCPNCHSQTASWAGRNKKVRSYRSPPARTASGGQQVLALFGDRDGDKAS